jgi:LytS/YehU family sensor histidine kinase
MQTVIGTFDYGVFLYFIVLLISHAVDLHDRYRREQLQATRLTADLAAAKLETLQAQLQPHFLFNTLNSISTLIPGEPVVARRVLARLSDFLRATLENRESRSVTVRREMELLDAYLEIEKTRLGDRLAVEVSVDREAERGTVPPLLLQPLVENAIRHGIAPRVGPGFLKIDVHRDGSWIEIAIRNHSAAAPTPEEPGHEGGGTVQEGSDGLGLGIANTRERLERLYAGHCSMDAGQGADGSFTVLVRLPYEEPAE